MSWETPEIKTTAGGSEDRERIPVAIGLELEGTVVRISDRQPSRFGGEVRYVDIDTTDGRKVTVSFSGWKLVDRFEPIGYQPGDGIRLRVVKKKSEISQKTYGNLEFQINRRGGAPAPAAPASAPETVAPSKPLSDEPPF